MDLATYLADARISQSEFARRIGVSQSLVWHWISGRKRVRAERVQQIEAATSGAVKRHELRPDLFDPPATAETEATA